MTRVFLARTVHSSSDIMRSFRPSSNAGFSLVEMLIVVSVISLTMFWAWPRANAIFNRSDVKGARNHIVNKFNLARTSARQGTRWTELIQDGSTIWIERTPRLLPGAGTRDTVGGVQDMNAMFGVTVAGVDTVRVDPRGIATTTAMIKFGKGGIRDSVSIFGFGGVSR